MKFTKLFAFMLLGFLASPLHADLFGPGNGRTANLDNLAGFSVEGAANLGGDVTFFGARINYKLSPDLVLFGDIGQADFNDFGGIAFGVGAFYQLRGVELLDNTDFAVKGSFHSATLELSGCNDDFDEIFDPFGLGLGGFADDFCDIDATEIAIEGLISGDQLSTTDLAWYGSAGIHIVDFGTNNTEIALGGGVVGDLAFGNWYAGAELVDEIYLTFGVRYDLN